MYNFINYDIAVNHTYIVIKPSNSSILCIYMLSICAKQGEKRGSRNSECCQSFRVFVALGEIIL